MLTDCIKCANILWQIVYIENFPDFDIFNGVIVLDNVVNKVVFQVVAFKKKSKKMSCFESTFTVICLSVLL